MICPAKTGAYHEQTTARTHSPAFKAKVALAAIRGDKTLAEWPASTTYKTVSQAKAGIVFYNTRRPHASLDRMTPDQFYFRLLPLPKAA